MKSKKTRITVALFWSFSMILFAQTKYLSIDQYGLSPNSNQNATPIITEILNKLRGHRDTVVIRFPKGRYDFHTEGSTIRPYYISNHDQSWQKRVAFNFEGFSNITLDGEGSDFIFHGEIIPFAIVDSYNCRLRNVHIDYEKPMIAQIKVLENNLENKTITYEVAPWVDFFVRDGQFFHKGEGWEASPQMGIAFEGTTKRIVYRTGDISTGVKGVTLVGERMIKAPWNNPKLIPGTVVAMRSWRRPTPGVFISTSKDIYLNQVHIHYAEGMGVLAQMSENIEIQQCSIALRGKDDPRYFTTQADATHFSGCKGYIRSTDCLYEGMMDDALNVHGTYLKVIKRIDNYTLQAAYMHSQSYGFVWGFPHDSVQFISSNTMEIIGASNQIKSIMPIDRPTVTGARLFEITFTKPIDAAIDEKKSFGIENLSWSPDVCFQSNIVRNNRARGILVSTPRTTKILDNLFDHTSGTAILLCGDCNGWYETGACRDVLIKGNRFINALTNMFQFTNAVISIYPEIPNLKEQIKYFHGGRKDAIIIEDNLFETFDKPILYAKSVDGILFKGNTVKLNDDYPSFHPIKSMFFFERVVNDRFEHNKFPKGVDLISEVERK